MRVPCEKFDTSEKSLGYAEVIETAPNGSWLLIEAIEFNKKGWARRKVRIKVDLFSAAAIAARVHGAIAAQHQHLNRVASMARGA